MTREGLRFLLRWRKFLFTHRFVSFIYPSHRKSSPSFIILNHELNRHCCIYRYGPKGVKGTIPGNAWLTFDVELVNVKWSVTSSGFYMQITSVFMKTYRIRRWSSANLKAVSLKNGVHVIFMIAPIWKLCLRHCRVCTIMGLTKLEPSAALTNFVLIHINFH